MFGKGGNEGTLESFNGTFGTEGSIVGCRNELDMDAAGEHVGQ